MATIDTFTYNGEFQVLKLHLAVLDPYVDRFIIVEANKTFTGEDKPLYFFRDQRFFKPWWKKIDYYVVNDWDDVELWQQAMNSPNTQGASHWKREFYIKESIHKALKKFNVQDDDLLFIGDVDEIINPKANYESDTPIRARLLVYACYFNNMSNEVFWGTLVAQYGDIKDKCLNHLRSDTTLNSQGDYLGWHFTSQGGLEEVRRKLNNTYSIESGNTPLLQQVLPERLKLGIDYIGRPFVFELNEDKWPQYLKDNRGKFHLLCK